MTYPGQILADPRLVRAVLAYVETHSKNQTVEQFGVHYRSIQRWIDRRAANHPEWPTDENIAAWVADQERRDQQYAVRRRYLQRLHFNGGRPLEVPRHGTMRRIQALRSLGWSQSQLGERLGVSRTRICHLSHDEVRGVRPETARQVAELYDELWDQVPTGPRAEAARTNARRNGWVSPLAWDDESIDDPDAKPIGVGTDRSRPKTDIDPSAVLRKMLRHNAKGIDLTKAERVEVCRRLRAEGWSDARIEEHTGLKVDRYLPKQTAVAA